MKGGEMPAKVLITGMANTGKTTLLKPLTNALVIARDGKPFSLELPHVNVPEYKKIGELTDLVNNKLDAYESKLGHMPDTLVFDSVSRIFTDIETNCMNAYSGYDVWSNVNKEMNQFLEYINEAQEIGGLNIVLIAHAVWDEKAGKYIETCKGSFAKIGGFLSTVDYAINIDIKGNKRLITHKGNSLSRTLLDGMPEKEDANNFNLQTYLDKIKAKSSEVTERWSI